MVWALSIFHASNVFHFLFISVIVLFTAVVERFQNVWKENVQNIIKIDGIWAAQQDIETENEKEIV